MGKALAGKRYFEALGRSDKSRGVPRSAKHYAWPQWAQQAYMRGRMLQEQVRRQIREKFEWMRTRKLGQERC